jgi:hypothetical protein
VRVDAVAAFVFSPAISALPRRTQPCSLNRVERTGWEQD